MKNNSQPPDLPGIARPQPTYRLTHARHDQWHCVIPEMFRSISKSGPRERVKISHQFARGAIVEVKMFEALGVDDMRILQGLVAMASVQHLGKGPIILGTSPASLQGAELRMLLDAEGEADKMDACIVRCSYAELAREIGYANPRDSAPIRSSIERLFNVTFSIQDGPARMSFRLLSRCASDAHGLAIALNPKIAMAVMGGQHIRISLAEVRMLQTDPARLIHQRLCGWVNQGATGARIDLDTLVSYVWPSKAAAAALWKRRRTATTALLKEIGGLPGWTTTEEATGKFLIKRDTFLRQPSRGEKIKAARKKADPV